MVGHGRRLRAGERASDARQPPHRARRRQRGRRDLQRPGEQVAAADHRRPAGARRRSRCEANLTNRDAIARAAAVRQVEPRAAARAGRPARARAGDPPRLAAAARTRVRLDPDGRLGRARPDPRRPQARSRRTVGRALGPDPRALEELARALHDARNPCSSRAPTSTRAAAGTPRWRSSRSSGWRCGRRPRPEAGGSASPRATRTSRGCCRRRSARPPRRSRATTSCSSWAPRCSPTTRTSPAPLLPEGATLVADHERPRRGRARADGQRDRRRRRARARAPARAARAPPSAPRPAARPLPGPACRCRADERLRRDGRARRRVAGRRDRRRRDAVEHDRAAQPPAAVEPRQLLLQRERRPRLRDRRRSRRAARRSRGRPVVCVLGEGSAQYGDHRAVDALPPTRCRSRSSCCATRST